MTSVLMKTAPDGEDGLNELKLDVYGAR